MNRRYLLTAVCVLGVLVSWWTGTALMKHLAYVGDLEEFRAREFGHWASTQRGMARSLDRACAEILVSDAGALRSALRSAGEQAYAAREALWSASPLAGIDSTVYRWNLHQYYERMGSYLYYLAERDGSLELNKVERGNVDLIREYAVLLHSGFDQVLARMQHEGQARQGHTEITPTSWRIMARDEGIPAALNQLGMDLSLKAEVGGDDPAYREYWDHRWAAAAGEHGLLESGEEELDEDEMLDRAVMFLRSLGTGEIIDDTGAAAAGSSTSARGHGSFFPVGRYTRFALTDGATGCRYRVGVTQVGGHVISLEITQYPDHIQGEAEALDFGLSILRQWQQLEAVSLRVVEEERSGGFLHLSHAPLVDGITYTDSTVRLVIALDDTHDYGKTTVSPPDGPALQLDARGYFAAYGILGDLQPRITADEAVAALAPTLTASGEPRLEAKGGSLRYVIPVTGVERVTAVYIGALCGAYEGMLYSMHDDGVLAD